MKSFIQFLKENKVEEELDSVLNPKYYSITESAMEPIDDQDDFDEEDDDFLDIADMNLGYTEDLMENDNESGNGVETGFGDEVYISLDTPSLMNGNKEVNESRKRKTDTEDSKTLKDLKDRRENGEDDDLEKVKRRNTNYKIADDGFTLQVKDENKPGEWRNITQDEVDAIVARKNRTSSPYASKSHYEFSQDGVLMTVPNEKVDSDNVDKNEDSNGKPLSKTYKTRFLKNLNDKVNDQGIHYKWQDGELPKLMINTTQWDDSNKRDINRFDSAEYRNIGKEDEDAVLNLVNKKKKQSSKPKKVIGFSDGHFTIDGKEMDSTQLQKFVGVLNGGVGGDTSMLNPKAWGTKKGAHKVPYWDSYKISIAGSKVGNAINFNLPPVQTCHRPELPCAKLCYAVKSYGAYPAVRGAEDCNFALLKRDNGFELFKKSMIYALNTPTKDGGKKFSLCRIHVSGDFFSEGYLRAICDVATACDHIKFWLYTKQYEILSKVGKGAIPDNLCVIVSCWGEYNPIAYKRKKGKKVGPFAHLANDFPLAYLDDESEEFKRFNDEMQEYLGKPKDVQYCPCTTAEQIVTRCESCKICFDKSLANNNLVFRLH